MSSQSATSRRVLVVDDDRGLSLALSTLLKDAGHEVETAGDGPEGLARFTDTVVGGRGFFTMSPRSFVAALVQYSSANTALSTNLRFRWEYQPGSELFVVYTEGRSTLPPIGSEALQSRGLVVKINRLFRF